ncbi:uncharacterized protein SAPINGB_P003356 [Magnusiomyces paraingens]|uniref:Uncharacterized protein n=1 Tax=Magnusiomyces paraingens TaxID=2606893 RepID=A0A5E8BWD0_9ASCO|nr:uncharacterized protein SAPINGB_P003356 [Saprochaete ingens]VVT53005.1 unnamed protein product [Saprochaete ingens]
MDSARLNAIIENTYIPSGNNKKSDAVPAHHPSLIMLDNQTDTTHHLKCGCCGGACITENAWWDKKKSVDSEDTDRPSYRRGSSSSSISTVSSYSSSSGY